MKDCIALNPRKLLNCSLRYYTPRTYHILEHKSYEVLELLTATYFDETVIFKLDLFVLFSYSVWDLFP